MVLTDAAPVSTAADQWPQVDHGSMPRRLFAMDRAGGVLHQKPSKGPHTLLDTSQQPAQGGVVTVRLRNEPRAPYIALVLRSICSGKHVEHSFVRTIGLVSVGLVVLNLC